ncbi:DNA-binding transcriptional regulator, GntR family [Cryobacterium flavum]|uniref:DNA-binding transcriptional regulator, GntR family n=1 Tax=Cryobacterium flavum TaxID=1424659 RepID=A0A5E9G1G1_9MICO|nr:GntR family transcriptional regulator [Cryobacterium flavum]SDN96657.1 DNA-binding transcriptional regulator, GntR family [Cryobacterium flavum]
MTINHSIPDDVVEQPVPYSEQTARIVRRAILAGNYAPGERLSEVELSKQLGISRSPIREGLRKLADEGLVVIHPGRGAFVAGFDLTEIRQLMEFRQALDVMAAGLAAERASEAQLREMQAALDAGTVAHRGTNGISPPWSTDFHLLVLQAASNPKIFDRGMEVHTQLHLVRFRSGSAVGSAETVHSEHQAILDAIRSGNAMDAEAAMRRHVAQAYDRIAHVVQHGE